MSKEQSAGVAESGMEVPDKIKPYEKLIASDQLYYLPNLYVRQYRAIDELVRLRQDFPEQRVLLQRPYTRWDAVLDEVRFRAKIVQEEKKFKIVQRAQTAKQLKLEVQRTALRNEENYHFQRLISSHLAEAALALFQQQSKVVEEVKQEVKEEEQKAVVKQNQDDIFVEGGDDYYDMPEENNLLDDLLNDPVVEKKEEYIEREEVIIQPISAYLAAKYAENKAEIDKEPRVSISRKASLRRINENVRKRLKIKEEEEEQPGRSLSSATVFLSNLLNTESESKSPVLVELGSRTEWLFAAERGRKRREEQGFQLRWSAEQMQKLQQRNDKSGVRKGKIDSNVLVVSMNNEQQQYRRHFQKNISCDKSFPPTLQNIPAMQVQRPRRYYNQFHDIEYETFIRKYNKRSIFRQFSAKAPFIFPENYSEDDFDENAPVHAGKIFVHPPQKVLDRIIYKISDYQMRASVKNDFEHLRLDLNEMIILTFLAKRYIRKFGNDWKSITKFIEMNPIFASHHITQEIVQEVYQVITKYDSADSLAEIDLWDKKILPFDYYGCYSYAEFDPVLHHTNPNPINNNPTTKPSSDTDDDLPPFDFERYSELINEPPEEPELPELENLEEQYRAFAMPLFLKITKAGEHSFVIDREDKFEKIDNVLQKFKESEEKVQYGGEERERRESVGKVLQEVLGLARGGEIKPAYPFRKKKNINERNNELVKILQALRNKNVNAPNIPPNKKPDEPNKAFPPGPPKSAPPTALVPPALAASKQSEPTDSKKVIAKSPDKEKKLGAPPKKDRKNKDGDPNK